MNTSTPSIEQQATISQINGNVQLMRDGFLLPAQAGQLLLPGDRLLTAANAKAVVQFTGVQDALIVEQGAATTFNLEVLENDLVPQWVARDIEGAGVFFESQAPLAVTNTTNSGVASLFGNESNTGKGNSEADSTGYPVLESIAGLAVTAAIFSDSESEDDGQTTPNTAATETDNNPPTSPSPSPSQGTMPDSGTPPAGTPPSNQSPEPMPEPEAQNPIGAVLEPVLSLLSLGAPAPLGSQSLSSQNPSVADSLDLNRLS